MRRLTLVRHAKSDWSLPGQADWDRALNRRGQLDAPEMARRLKHRKLKPDLILTSPAVRALATASIIAHALKVRAELIRQDERLYLSPPKELLTVVQELGGGAQHLMVFGHNPGITEFANLLSGGEQMDNMPTCAVFTALFDVTDWGGLDWSSGQQVEFDYPKNPA